jgi:hypothetical protein
MSLGTCYFRQDSTWQATYSIADRIASRHKVDHSPGHGRRWSWLGNWRWQRRDGAAVAQETEDHEDEVTYITPTTTALTQDRYEDMVTLLSHIQGNDN